MKEKNTVKNFMFCGWHCYGEAIYRNGALSIQLRDVQTHEPVATATTNLGIKLNDDEAFIKDYSENRGMLDALKDAGIVTAVLGHVSSGFADEIPLCKINTELLKK